MRCSNKIALVYHYSSLRYFVHFVVFASNFSHSALGLSVSTIQEHARKYTIARWTVIHTYGSPQQEGAFPRTTQ